jgi:hypothetical protein
MEAVAAGSARMLKDRVGAATPATYQICVKLPMFEEFQEPGIDKTPLAFVVPAAPCAPPFWLTFTAAFAAPVTLSVNVSPA